MPGLCLIGVEQRDLAARDAERVDLAPQLPGEAQEHRPEPVRQLSSGSLTTRIINLVNYSTHSSELPAAVGDERRPASRTADAVGFSASVPIITSMCVLERLTPYRLLAERHGARLREARAEGHVRGGVLVEQAVVVDAARLADTRGAVDERDLAEPVGVRDRGEVAGEPVAVGLALRLRAARAARRGTRPRALRSCGRRSCAAASSGTCPRSRRRRAR